MPQVQLLVKAANKYNDNNVSLSVVNDQVAFNRTVTPYTIDTLEKLASWLINQISTCSINQNVHQGILTIDYHSELITEESGGMVTVNIIDNIDSAPLPLLLTQSLDEIINSVNAIQDINDVKNALKDMAKTIHFLKMLA